MKEKKLTKVTLEYDNGEVQTLSGKQAQEWISKLDSALTLNFVHGVNFPEFKWKHEKRKH